MRRSAAAQTAGLLLAVLAGGCGPRGSGPPPPDLTSEQVAILALDRGREPGGSALAMLRGWLPEAPIFGPADLREGLERCLGEGRVLVVPEAARFPFNLWPLLEQYLTDGGPAVFLGRRPFALRVWDGGQGLQTEQAFLQALYERSETGLLGSVQRWERSCDSGTARGFVRMVGTDAAPAEGILVDVEAFGFWDLLESPDGPARPIPSGSNTLLFFARGDRGTSQLCLLAETQEGQEAYAVVPLARRWELHAVHEALFRPTGNDGPAAPFSLDRLRRLRVGLHTRYAPQAEGSHRFGISSVRFARDPRDRELVTGVPGKLGFPAAPQPLEAPTAYAVMGESSVSTIGVPMESSTPLPRGAGGAAAGPLRWAPLYEVPGTSGTPRGWPAALYVRESTDGGAPARWAWVGMDLTATSGAAVRPILSDAVTRLHRGSYLLSAGMPRFALPSGERLLVTASWVQPPGAEPVRLSAELRDEGGRVLRRVLTSPLPPDGAGPREHELNLGLAPSTDRRPAEVTLHIALVSATGRAASLDAIEQPLKVLPRERTSTADDWLAATGSRLTLQKRPLLLVGVEYGLPPPAAAGLPGEQPGHWLDPDRFDPVLFRRDLEALAGSGVNALSFDYTDPGQAPQLLYVLDEAKKNSCWVLLHVAGLDPLAYNPPRARALIEAAALQEHAEVFAFTLSHRRSLGREAERRRLDGEWGRWLVARYGSVDAAEAQFGQAIWRHEGEVTGPPDAALETDGPHRPAVLAYRHFIDDALVFRYGAVRRFLRRLGCRQLLTAATGYGSVDPAAEGRLPLDPGAGAVHLDFVSIPASALFGPQARFEETTLLPVYARARSGGKPVVWTGFHVTPVASPGAADQALQRAWHRDFFRCAWRSRSAGLFAGCASWSARDGRPMQGQALLGQDGSWKPVEEAFVDLSTMVRREKMPAPAWKGRVLDRLIDGRGFAAVWENWAHTYGEESRRDAVEEMREAAYNQSTTAATLTGLGGKPYEPPGPFREVNAAWGRVVVEGVEQVRWPRRPVSVQRRDRLELELLNTGPAMWAASGPNRDRTVWVEARHASRRPDYLEVRALGPGKTQTIEWVIPDIGAWTLQPLLLGVGPFGEPLEMVAEPYRPLLQPEAQ